MQKNQPVMLNESTHDLTVGVSSLDRTSSDSGKPTTSQSGFYRDKKLPISVAMVVYDEEDLIARALKSCADLVDDIVIVHDGVCKDRTLEIAEKFTNKIFVVDHIGAPEPHRPFSFAHTKHNWVLQLDADEYLDKDFRNQLPRLIKKDVPGYTINWIEEANGKRFVNMTKEVLFQKNRVYYIGAPCEYIKPIDPRERLLHVQAGLVNSPIKSNYRSWKEYTEKYSKISKIQADIYSRPFSALKNWNYPGKDWEMRTKLKIQHPILMGVLGMNIKYLIELIKNIVGIKSPVSIPAALHQMWYNTTLYWRLFQIKRKKPDRIDLFYRLV